MSSSAEVPLKLVDPGHQHSVCRRFSSISNLLTVVQSYSTETFWFDVQTLNPRAEEVPSLGINVVDKAQGFIRHTIRERRGDHSKGYFSIGYSSSYNFMVRYEHQTYMPGA